MFRRRTPEPSSAEHATSRSFKDLPPEFQIVVHMTQLAAREHNRPANEEQFESMLRNSGYAEIDVRRALVFVPIAFCGDVLERMGIRYSEEDTYFVSKDNSGESEQKHLSDEPLYLAARSAIRFVMDQLGNAPFLYIASMSAEMSAINNAIQSGATVEGMRGSVISPPIIPEHLLRKMLGR